MSPLQNIKNPSSPPDLGDSQSSSAEIGTRAMVEDLLYEINNDSSVVPWSSTFEDAVDLLPDEDMAINREHEEVVTSRMLLTGGFDRNGIRYIVTLEVQDTGEQGFHFDDVGENSRINAAWSARSVHANRQNDWIRVSIRTEEPSNTPEDLPATLSITLRAPDFVRAMPSVNMRDWGFSRWIEVFEGGGSEWYSRPFLQFSDDLKDTLVDLADSLFRERNR